MDYNGLSQDFDVDYFLLEKPFKQFVDQFGSINLDLNSFLLDGRTKVLSAALPIAVTMGFKRIGLVGCDSDYNQMGSANYFYDNACTTRRARAGAV